MTSSKIAEVARDRTDWARLRAMSEDEIESMAGADDDNPATVDDDERAHATGGLSVGKSSVHASSIETNRQAVAS